MSNFLLLIVIIISVACNKITVTKIPPKVPVANICSTNCRMFVSQPHDGNLGGAAGADTLCSTDSNKPATGTYKALLMDTSRDQSKDWVLKPNTTYYRTDGTTLVGTTGTEGVFNLGSVGFFAVEDPLPSQNYFTGMMWTSNTRWDVDGNPAFHCMNWTSNSHTHFGNSGLTGDPSDFFISENAQYCDTAHPIVCVEQ